MYGVDMIEAEKILNKWVENIPEIVNDLPMCPGGTTEEMCLYFAKLQMVNHIPIISVSVSETPERVTILRCDNE